MWIKMKKNYPGLSKPIKGLERNSYLAGSEYDLPRSAAMHLIANKFAVETTAPWNRKQNVAEAQIKSMRTKIEMATAALDIKKQKIKEAQKVAKTIKPLGEEIKADKAAIDKMTEELTAYAKENKIQL